MKVFIVVRDQSEPPKGQHFVYENTRRVGGPYPTAEAASGNAERLALAADPNAQYTTVPTGASIPRHQPDGGLEVSRACWVCN